MRAEPVDRWFNGDGIRVHGLDWGGPADGRLVLFLHGVGGNAWIWDPVATRLRAAVPGHRLIALDGRDGGDTDHPPIGYERERFVADVAAVHDALGGQPMTLVGHSRGGWLAASVAAVHPARVERLVLVDPARLVFAAAADADSFYASVRAGLGPFDSEAAAVAWARASEPDAAWTEARIRSLLFGLRRLPDGRLAGKLPLEALPQLQAARAVGAAGVEELARISAPTLLIVADRQSPARRADKLAYAERIANVRVVHLDGTHHVHTDRPAEVSATIAGFVSA
jgi:pimeloyl-ACP methyl ester carboxylesterase